jgi:hypothetical protein
MNLLEKHGIPTVSCTFRDLEKEIQVDENTGVLSIFGKEVALVYYQTGFKAEDYYLEGSPGEVDPAKWQVRTKLECSLAVKCPSIDMQLACFK